MRDRWLWAMAALCLLPLHGAFAAPLAVQTLVFKGRTTNGDQNGQVTMPFVHGNDKAVAARINDLLFIARHQVLAPRQPGRTLSAADGIVLEGLASQTFTVPRNDGRILSIAFEGEGCGAYCESFRDDYAFDARDGRLLTPDNLFTDSGIRSLAARLENERVKRYRAQLADLRAELAAARRDKKTPADDITDLQDRIALNQTCLAERLEAAKATPVDPGEARRRFNYRLTATTLESSASRCSNHALRALDDVGEVTLALPYAQLAPWLSAYAQAVLFGPAAAAPPPSPEPVFGQLLRGELSAAGTTALPITMLLNLEYDGSVSGTYLYDRVRRPIALGGVRHGTDLTLTEDAGSTATPDTDKPVFKLRRSGTGLQGDWVGRRTLSVRLAP